MARENNLYLNKLKESLELIRRDPNVPRVFYTEISFSEMLDVSRSTVRKIVSRLMEMGLIQQEYNKKVLVRFPEQEDFNGLENPQESKSEIAEKFVNEFLSSEKAKPGVRFSTRTLAQECGCHPITMSETLMKISKYGFLEKEKNRGWKIVRMNPRLRDEIYEMRELLETRSLIKMIKSCANSKKVRKKIEKLLDRHLLLKGDDSIPREKMFQLDEQFHGMIHDFSDNRFIQDYFVMVKTLIYSTSRKEHRKPSDGTDAVLQHIDVLQAVLDNDESRALHALHIHLKYSKDRLILPKT